MSGERAISAILLSLALAASGLAADADLLAANLSKLLDHHNRGVSLMERHQFQVAAKEFLRVTKLAPDWPVGYVNLGLALMNEAKHYDKAEAAFRKVLELDGANPYAHFSLGVMLESLGRREESMKELEAAAKAAPNDPDIHFKLGQAHQAKRDLASAEAEYRRAVALDASYSSALYALGILEIRQKKTVEGKAHLDLFEKLRRSREGRTWGLKYTEMGHYADIIRLASPAASPHWPRPAKIVLTDVTPQGKPYSSPAYSLALADLEGDGGLDLVVGSPVSVRRFALKDGALASSGKLSGISGGDVWLIDQDNDGAFELVHPPSIYRRKEGAFAASKPIEGLEEAVSLTMAEVDADGDVDIVAAGKTTALFVNNRDGSFRRIDLPGKVASSAVLAFDADGDVDSDILLLGEKSRIFRNDRIWRFVEGPALPIEGSLAAADVADLDGDGVVDIATCGKGGLFLLSGKGGLRFRAKKISSEPCTALFVADMDRSGTMDLVVAQGGDEPAIVVDSRDGRGSFEPAARIPLPASVRAMLPIDLEGDGDPDIVAALGRHGLRLLESKGSEESHSLALSLNGPAKASEARSNRQGIGATIEVKSGGRVAVAMRSAGAGHAQNYGPVYFGLDGRGKADYVRILWPEGVIQSEPELAAGAHSIDEVERKAGSCPTLFAWDGARYGFVADFLGGGGVGFFVAKDLYAPPDPVEYLRIPALARRDGRYEIKVLEPLEELTYLDEVKLLAIEHPSDVDVYPDERFSVTDDLASGRILGVRDRIFPEVAVSDDGRDVTSSILEVDRDYAGPAKKDERFLGMAEPWSVTLRFPESAPMDGYLFLEGYIEYGYSQTVFAAGQAGVEGQAPTLDYLDPKTGRFVEAAVMGYPAGTDRMMTFPLAGKIPKGAVTLRIRSSLTVYWDQIFAAQDRSPGGGYPVTVLPPDSAELRFTGYPREFSPDGRLPLLLDYENRDLTRGFKQPTGRYTRFGEVLPLLGSADDRFVIMGPGEEVAISFNAAKVPIPSYGNRVTFVLKSDGFCKDMDLYTAAPDTVAPLPFHAMSGYPYKAPEHYPRDESHRRYQVEWNRRLVPRSEAP